MRTKFFYFLVTVFALFEPLPVFSQSTQPLGDDEHKLRNELLFHLPRLIENNYVFPEEGRKIASHLTSKVKEGFFNQFQDKDSFAKALTKEVRSVNGDLHLNIQAMQQTENERDTFFMSEVANNYYKLKSEYHGFNTAQNFNNGIGYLKLNLFRNSGIELADWYMGLLQYSDALIIDLRDNHGGTVEMVQYLLSYFYEDPLQISTIYGREGAGKEHWTLDVVKGQKLSKVPLFILVNHETASGAEGFAYVIQNTKRGIVIGETTMGAAHSGGTWYINGYSIFIPSERSVSPVTGTNWEGTGVVPNIVTEKNQELEQALNLAKDAAVQYRKKCEQATKKSFNMLDSLLKTARIVGSQPEHIHELREKLSELTNNGLLNELNINDLGYAFIEEQAMPVAEIIFMLNVELFPQSPNACDSYAECLALNGKVEKSILFYEKAIRLAIEYNSGTEATHKENLDKVRDFHGKKKK